MWTFSSWSSLHASALLLIKRITLSLLLQIEDSEEDEQEEEASQDIDVIPPYSEKDSNVESGARGSQRGAASLAVPVLPLLLLLPAIILDWEWLEQQQTLITYFAYILPLLPLSSPSHQKWITQDSCEKEL